MMDKASVIVVKAFKRKDSEFGGVYWRVHFRDLETWEEYAMNVWNRVPESLRFLPYLKFGQVFTNIQISNKHKTKDGKLRIAYYKSDFVPIPNKFRDEFYKCDECAVWAEKYKEHLGNGIDTERSKDLVIEDTGEEKLEETN